MPKFKDLSTAEKCFKIGMDGTGFLMGALAGGCIKEVMIQGGWNGIIANTAGVMITAAYTKLFDWSADIVITERRLSVADEERLAAELAKETENIKVKEA